MFIQSVLHHPAIPGGIVVIRYDAHDKEVYRALESADAPAPCPGYLWFDLADLHDVNSTPTHYGDRYLLSSVDEAMNDAIRYHSAAPRLPARLYATPTTA